MMNGFPKNADYDDVEELFNPLFGPGNQFKSVIHSLDPEAVDFSPGSLIRMGDTEFEFPLDRRERSE